MCMTDAMISGLANTIALYRSEKDRTVLIDDAIAGIREATALAFAANAEFHRGDLSLVASPSAAIH